MSRVFRRPWFGARIGGPCGFWLLCQLWGSCAAPPPPIHIGAAEPTSGPASVVSISRHWTVEQQQPRGPLRVREEVRVRRKIRSRRRLGRLDVTLYDGFFSPLRKVLAFVDGRAVPKQHIRYLRPVSRSSFLDDIRTYRIHYSNVRSGQTVSYRYNRTHSEYGLLPLPMVPNAGRLESYTLQVDHPPHIRVKTQLAAGPSNVRPLRERLTGRTRLLFRNLNRFDYLPYYPFNHRHTRIAVLLQNGGYTLQPMSVARRAAWARRITNLRPSLTDANKTRFQALVESATSPADRMKRLYDFVRKQIRYIADERGRGGLVPRPAHVVLKRGWGDCKDKARLLVELARDAGIEAHLVLVAVGHEQDFRTLWPDIYDHVIVAWKSGGRLHYMDPVGDTVEFGNLPEMDVDRPALVLAPTPLALRLPAPNTQLDLVMHVDMLPSAATKGRARITLRNSLLHNLRSKHRGVRGKIPRRWLRKVIQQLIPGVDLQEMRLATMSQDHAVIIAEADLSRLITISKRSIQLPASPIGLFTDQLQKRVTDALPVLLPSRVNAQLRLRLAGVTTAMKAAFRSHHRAPGVASYLSHIYATNNTLSAVYTVRQQKRYLHGGDKRAFLRLHKRYGALSARHLSWPRKASGRGSP